jgi:hypothetical protein
MMPAVPPAQGKPAVQIDGLLWFTPSVSLTVGPFSQGDVSLEFHFKSLALDWQKPIVDPSLQIWGDRQR